MLTDTTLMIWAHPPEEGLSSLAFLDLPSGKVEEAADVLARMLKPFGRSVQVISPPPAKSQVYQAMLPHVHGSDALVIWAGNASRYEIAAEGLHAFLEENGRLLVVSSSPRQLDDHSRDLFHIEEIKRGQRRELRSLFLPDSPVLSGSFPPFGIRWPAKSLFSVGESLTGVFVEDGYRAALVPLRFKGLLEAPYDLYLEAAISLLMEDTTVATLRGAGQPTGSAFLASAVEEPVTVRALVQGDQVQAELMVRHLDGQGGAGVPAPMRRIGYDGEVTAFDSEFGPQENERYMLTLNLYNADGQWMPNSAQLGLVGYRSSADILVLLATMDDAHTVRPAFESALTSSGKTAAFLAQEKLGEFSEALLLRYAEEGKTVYSFDGSSTEERRRTIRRLAAHGAKFVLFYPRLTSRNSGYAQEVLRASDPSVSSSRMVTSAGLLQGEAVELKAQQFVTLLPPSVPLLADEDGRVAGWYVQQEEGAFAVMGVNYKRIDEASFEELVGLTLGIFERADIVSELGMADKERIGHTYLAAPGERLTVRVKAVNPVESLDVVVWPIDDATAKTSVETTPSDGGWFEAPLTINDDRAHMAVARVVTADGGRHLSGGSISIMAGIPETSTPTMAIIHDDWPKARNFRAELRTLLAELDVPAFIVDQRAEDVAVVNHLLGETVTDDGLVLWLSEQVREGEIKALRRYVERGGRLLLACGDMGDNQVSNDFLRDILGVSAVGLRRFKEFTIGSEEKPLRIHYHDLVLTKRARPLLRDTEGTVAGARVAADGYRAVFYPFDIWAVGMGAKAAAARAGRARVLERALTFLNDDGDAGETLRIATILAPSGVIRAGQLRPRIVVSNDDDFPSDPFRVGYRITADDSVIAAFETVEHPLAASSQREILLSEWTGGAGEVSVEIGIGTGDGPLEFGDPFPVSLIDVRGRLVQTELPIQASSANGAGFFDYDQDGDDDLYIVRTAGANQLFRNDAGEFVGVGSEAGLADSSMGRGMAVGDYDGDGYPDVYLTNSGHPNRLMNNDGGQRFQDVTAIMSVEGSRALADSGLGRSAGFFDADNDGDLDLYFVNATSTLKMPNRFFTNEGATFRDDSQVVGLDDQGSGKGLAFADVDGDADVDLFIANTEGSKLFRNTEAEFVDDTEAAGLRTTRGSVGCVFGDYDNDGDVDLFVANEAGWNQLFANRSDGSFEEIVRDQQYLGEGSVGAALFDYDNDGDLDLATTAVSSSWGGDELFSNRDSRFVPIGRLLEMPDEGSGRGLSVSDYDLDGDLDLVVAQTSGPRLYRNLLFDGDTLDATDDDSSPAGWLSLSLIGAPGNLEGIGATVELFAEELGMQRRDIFGPVGYTSHGSPHAHFGLGTASRVDSLRVRWPDGAVSVQTKFGSTDINRYLTQKHPMVERSGYLAGRGQPEEFLLEQGYPNPFNAEVSIPFAVAADGSARLELFNMAGQRVRLLINQELQTGYYRPRWDGTDDAGRTVGSGVYIYRLQAGEFEQSRRLLLLK